MRLAVHVDADALTIGLSLSAGAPLSGMTLVRSDGVLENFLEEEKQEEEDLKETVCIVLSAIWSESFFALFGLDG